MSTIAYLNLSNEELVTHIRMTDKIDLEDVDELAKRLEGAAYSEEELEEEIEIAIEKVRKEYKETTHE